MSAPALLPPTAPPLPLVHPPPLPLLDVVANCIYFPVLFFEIWVTDTGADAGAGAHADAAVDSSHTLFLMKVLIIECQIC